MNISGIVVRVKPSSEGEVIENMKQSDFCEYHIHENGKIIVTIEAKDFQDELDKISKIRSINHVLSAEISYTYCESELHEDKQLFEAVHDIPEWLNDENVLAEDIKYNGNFKTNPKNNKLQILKNN